MSSRTFADVATAVAVIASAALTSTAPAQAASCKKYKEASGCKLPSGTSYQVTRGANDELNLTVDRGKAKLALRSACVQNRSISLSFKSVPKVGRSYSFAVTKTEVAELREDISVTYTYMLTLKVKINSASKATTSGTATVSAPGVPPQGSFAGEDPYNANCKLDRTLKRVVER